MNKILLVNNNIETKIDDKIEYEYISDSINKLKIKIKKNTKLEIYIKNDIETKLDIQYEILENVKLKLVEIKKGSKTKILSKYNLKESSDLNLIKVNNMNNINERNLISLDGKNSKINCLLKTVAVSNEKYDIIVNHNYGQTFSNIITNGINISGNIYINVTTYILKDRKKCIANQSNRIINLTDKECIIRPNLLIDEVDVIANHSALIGTFSDEEMFYMQRLGIDKKTTVKLLIEGFIKNGLNKKLANNFKKYWR